MKSLEAENSGWSAAIISDSTTIWRTTSQSSMAGNSKSSAHYADIKKEILAMQNTGTEKINIEIMENELAACDWELNPLAWELYWWISFFQAAFFKGENVPIPALTFERSRVNNLGSYRIGRNDWAVREQINLNRLYLNRPIYEVLATLFHEMVHSWEYTYMPPEKRTKSWYHSKAFRGKMGSYGILCNTNGSHVGLEYKGKFVQALKQHGVAFDGFDASISGGSSIVPIDPKPTKKGKSKLKKWTCGCQIVRVGKREFSATCDICNNKFRLDE